MTPAQIKAFDTWVESTLSLRYFRAHELRFLGGSHYDIRHRAHGKNSLPTRDLWKNIIVPACVADMARGEHGSPIRILSAYRNEDYNQAIRGARFSRHRNFDALDLAPMDGRVSALVKILKRLRAEGHFKGGIGVYPNFVHIDNRGTNVDF